MYIEIEIKYENLTPNNTRQNNSKRKFGLTLCAKVAVDKYKSGHENSYLCFTPLIKMYVCIVYICDIIYSYLRSKNEGMHYKNKRITIFCHKRIALEPSVFYKCS